DVIEHHNFESLADIFNECHEDLKALTVSLDKIEQLMKICKENGAIAGKLTGDGSCGSMLLIAKDLPTSKNIVKDVEKAG
ncbi:mevalonate kinase, partial [Staphylococcus aureus]|nr:mevalonate kinase [Staphylococcus aureus]